MAITRRQREVYDFISRFVAEHGYSPSFDEIGTGLKLIRWPRCTSTSPISRKRDCSPRLQTAPLHRPAPAQGTPQAGHEREHRLVLPLLGRIAAASPSSRARTIKPSRSPTSFAPKEVFVSKSAAIPCRMKPSSTATMCWWKAEDGAQRRHRSRTGRAKRRHAEALLPRRR